MNKLKIGRSTKSEDNLNSFQIVKCKMGMSKFTKSTKNLEKGNV